MPKAMEGWLGTLQAGNSMPYIRSKIHFDCQLLAIFLLAFGHAIERLLGKPGFLLLVLAILSLLSLLGSEVSR